MKLQSISAVTFMIIVCFLLHLCHSKSTETDDNVVHRENKSFKMYIHQKHERMFKNFIAKFKKKYSAVKSVVEYYQRFKNFKESMRRYELLNKLHAKFGTKFGITQFSDLTPQEFQDQHLKHKPQFSQQLPFRFRKVSVFTVGAMTKVPKKIDWRTKGAVTAVKNQGSCGACWAYADVETVESMHKIQKGTLPELSVQQVMDCAGYGNTGCAGGDVALAADWLVNENIFITSASKFPDTNKVEQCFIQYINEENGILSNLAYHGPVAVAVDSTVWQDYIGGIIQHHCSNSINHAVQIVGYDISGSVPFYIIRNSWGTGYGDNGYLYIKVGANLCGLATEVVSLDVL